MYTVKSTGISAYDGNDIGVYCNEQLIKGFNTLSDDYAYTNAFEYRRKLERKESNADYKYKQIAGELEEERQESNQTYKYKQIVDQLNSGEEIYTLKVGNSKHVNITPEQVQQIANIFKDN